MANYDFSGNPRLVGVQLTESTHQYLTRCLELGALEGPLGDMKVTQEVAAILQALHVVLAGGKVNVQVESQGNPDVFNELNSRMEAAGRDANVVNELAGYFVVPSV
ncbi:MAG: hypothetical protein RL653_2703 [Pseudomonadota bacterium]|jgi:hypothetical protein